MVGETLGSYKILSLLGSGGMGQVYLAEHRHLRRKAAVKVLSRELTDRPDLLERFFLEARATSAIEHPGIVQIFDCELDGTGRPYIVMEFLNGETLAASMARRGPLPPVVAAKIARGIAEALAAAHDKGIVHRDLKPDNIFVLPQPPDTVKLVDFGIAKLAGDFHAGQVHQTRSGVFMGTPLYMSPEQCRDAARTDFRTDLYSLGCVFYEMLTGKPPFTHTGIGELIVAHMNVAPKAVREVNPAVPPALDDIVAALLRKDPAARPASMREVADRLLAFVGQVTTVPEAALAATAATAPRVPTQLLPAAAPPATPVDTTFARTASEVMSNTRIAAAGRRGLMAWGIGTAVVALAAGGFIWSRKREPAPVPAVAVVAVAPAPEPKPAVPPAAAPPAAPTPTPTPAEAAAPAQPAAAPVAAAPAAAEPSVEKLAAARRGDGKVKLAKASGKPAAPPPASPPSAPPAPAEPPRAAPPTIEGLWEGPWTDGAKQQRGIFRLQVNRDGTAAGWMKNSVANQTFRMAGRLTPAGQLDLVCECAPAEPFVARGAVHAGGDNELRGTFTLSSSSAGVFGHSQLVLKRGK